jgi:anaerobic magnesium-protoporphyrin IX monomethyl ester cyclase
MGGDLSHRLERDAPCVTLIRPPRILSRTALNTVTPVAPLTLAYLTAALRAEGIRTVAIDGCSAVDQCTPLDDLPYVVNGLTADEIADRVDPTSVFIGISCMFSREWMYQKRVIQTVRRRFPHIPIVAGGEHITADPEFVFRDCPEVTACALGEGEETIVELARAFANGTPLADVPGLALVGADGPLVRTPKRARLRAIDALPWPAWDALPIEVYLDRGFGMDEYLSRSIPMLASRGCPYTCTFCSNPSMWGTKWLARDPDDVVAEIAHYRRTYGIEHVEFFDLTTIVDRRWILRFTARLIEANLGITWTMPSGTRSEALDAEVLDSLRRSGCRGVTYAPESGSPATLKRIKKRVDPNRMLDSIRVAVASGLYVKAHLIVGLPRQPLREVWESFTFGLRLALAGVDDLLVYPFSAYPGSELYRELVAAGRIDPSAPDYDRKLLGADYGDSENTSWSEHFSARTVRSTAAAMMLVFYVGQFLLRPWRALRAGARLVSGRPKTWFERTISGQLRRKISGRFVPAGTATPARVPFAELQAP